MHGCAELEFAFFPTLTRRILNLMFISFLYSDLCVPTIDEDGPSPRSGSLIIEAAFLAKHGIFRRLNPGAERRPSPPDQKQCEHDG